MSLPRLLIVLLGSMMLTACASRPPAPAARGPLQVLVARRGWHVDVGFDVRQLQGPLTGIAAQFPGARYLFFGFGDERYIRAHSHHWPSLLMAVWPGRGVMLVTALDNTPAAAFGAAWVAEISVSAQQHETLQEKISDGFSGLGMQRSPLQEGPYADSLYYAATQNYSGFHTCNTWAAEILQAAQLPVSSRGVLLAGQVWKQVRPLARAGAD